MSKKGKGIKAKNWLLAGVIALSVPIIVVYVSFDEIVDRAVTNGRIVDIIADKSLDQNGVVAWVEISEGNRAQVTSIPQSVQIGDEVPLIVETHLNKKITYRLDESEWKRANR